MQSNKKNRGLKPLSIDRDLRFPISPGSTALASNSMVGTMEDCNPEKERPKICLGMPLYNQIKFLPEALSSLLAQTYSDFRLVMVDDSTEPGPGEIAKQFAAKDSRLCYIKNESRKGLVDNWRACFQCFGNIDYFAWVSDHDVWDRTWLAAMVDVMNARPDVVLVYPRTVHISSEGERLIKKGRDFLSTDGMSEVERIKTVYRHGPGLFGEMVYGLFHAESLRQCGVFRRVLFPDAILLLELCFYGNFHQVDAELWFRRHLAAFNISRQKRLLFVRKPWYIYAPWFLVGTVALAWNAAIRPDDRDIRLRFLALKQSIVYLAWSLDRWGEGSWLGSIREWRRLKKPWIKRMKRRLKRKDKTPEKTS
jgi:glycosyltransferase involved in cell wall biosynthesis